MTYILRPAEDSLFRFVGECYVHDVIQVKVSSVIQECGQSATTFKYIEISNL